MNTPFILERKVDTGRPPYPRLVQVWRVDVDDTYHVERPGGMRHFGLFVVSSGEGTIGWGSESTKPAVVKAGEAYLVPPHVSCVYGTVPGGHWRFHCVEFDHLPDDPGVSLLPAWRSFSIPGETGAEQLCDMMIRELSDRAPAYALEVQAQLFRLLVRLSRWGVRDPDPDARRINELTAWLRENLAAPVDVDQMVAISRMSRVNFFRTFRRVTGTSPHRYLSELRLQTAAFLLQSSRLTVAQIADRLQFSDQFHLSRRFRARFGQSPRAYRRAPGALVASGARQATAYGEVDAGAGH